MGREPLLTKPKPVQLLTIREAADRLRCSPNHIYRLIALGRLRAVDVSLPGSLRSKTRIREDDLATYVKTAGGDAGAA